MTLRHAYTLFAPVYDALIRSASAAVRAKSLARLAHDPPSDVLISGIGTGLDVPHLPPRHRYVGIDLTHAMLERVPRGVAHLSLVQGDAMRLPFADARFDAAVLHLIVAVVPHPERALAEAARVTRPGGRLLVLDKFLRPGQPALLRRALNPLSRRIATRLDVVFEDALAAAPKLRVVSDQPALVGGWFRLIELRRI